MVYLRLIAGPNFGYCPLRSHPIKCVAKVISTKFHLDESVWPAHVLALSRVNL